MDKHPFYDLMEKFDTDMTELEKIALYGVMRTSTHPGFEKLTVEEVWARMLVEFDQWRAECRRADMEPKLAGEAPEPSSDDLLKAFPIDAKFKM